MTQPLKTNYGGLLQAYALQFILRSKGYEVVTDNKENIKYSLIHILEIFFKKLILKFIFKRNIQLFSKNQLSKKRVDNINTNRFIKENIKTIDLLNGHSRPSKKDIRQFDAIIVGSDQVWRPLYSNIPLYMLDFLKTKKIKRIAYAASFGLDNTSEFYPYIYRKAKKLLKKFDGISVREISGVNICEKDFGVKALHVLDPTMLLKKQNYEELVTKDSRFLKKSKGNLFTYILDGDENKYNIISCVSKLLSLKPFNILPKEGEVTIHNMLSHQFVYPPVTQWLKSFIDAEFIITDSFHGTVFSIIFQKPFLVILNKKRGASRFESLLKLFNLENRLITSVEQVPSVLKDPIDYNSIEHILNTKRQYSIRFLLNLLNKKS